MQIVKFQSSNQQPYPLQVAGESYYRANIEAVSEHLDEDDGEGVDSGEFVARLILDDQNQHDPGNAVRVEIDGQVVGHLSKKDAQAYRKRLAQLGLSTVIGECRASISGGFALREGGFADYGVRLDLDLNAFSVFGTSPPADQIPPAKISSQPSARNSSIPSSISNSAANRGGGCLNGLIGIIALPFRVLADLVKGLLKPETRRSSLILVGTLLGVCLVCITFGSFLPDPPSTPTADPNTIQTTIAETALALVAINPTETPSPTITSLPASTDIPIEDYARVAAARFQTLQEAMNELVPLHQALIADMSLAANPEWYATMSATLFRVETGASELAAMKNVPPEYALFHQTILQLENETKLAAPEYTQALDHQDVEALNRATGHLGNMITYINQANAELTRLNVPPTIAPTATVLVIVPTAPPQQSNCIAAYPDFCIAPGDRKSCDELPSNFTVLPPDPLGYDRDNDGVGCES